MKTKIIATICLSLIGCCLAVNVWAVNWLPLVPCGKGDRLDSGLRVDECKLCHLWQMASNLINFVIFGLSVPLAALLFAAAGVVLLTAGGSETKVKQAREIFFKTLIGLLIIFCSWLVVDTLVKTLVNPSTESGQVIWAWNQFPSCQ